MNELSRSDNSEKQKLRRELQNSNISDLNLVSSAR